MLINRRTDGRSGGKATRVLDGMDRPVLRVTGLVQLRTSAQGDPVVIRSNKARAILVLLATAPEGQRSRAWLQSKLWSDRAPEQAAASLRQDLSKLRASLSDLDIGFCVERTHVSVDLDKLQVCDAAEGAFLEDLDIRDPAFQDWLMVERARRGGADPQIPAPALTRPVPWHIHLAPQTAQGGGAWFEHLLCDAAAKHLRDMLSADISVGGQPPDRDRLLQVRAQVFHLDGKVSMRVALTHAGTRHQIWSDARSFRVGGAPPVEHPEWLGLIADLTAACAQWIFRDGVQRPVMEADALCGRAINGLFSMLPDRIAEADELFAAAHEADPRGLYLAWRAQLRTVQFVERHDLDVEVLRDEGAAFIAHALETEPDNAMVAALAANTAGHLLKQTDRSLELGQLSVQLNPANAMGWWALSSASLYADKLDACHAFALRGRKLAGRSPHRFWWDQQVFGAVFMQGRFDEAVRLTQTIHALNPNFRPPLRYLFAMLAQDGQDAAAAKVAETLKRLEPDFSPERLVQDRGYPASLVHRAPGMNTDRLRAFF